MCVMLTLSQRDACVYVCVLGSRCPMLLQIIRVDVCAVRLSKLMQGLEERIELGPGKHRLPLLRYTFVTPS